MKKIRGILFALVLILCASIQIFAKTGPSLTIAQVASNPGKSIEVPIEISNNMGICGAELTLNYDEALILTSIATGEAFRNLTFTKPGNLEANPVKLLWDGMEDDKSNGIVLVLTFTVPNVEGIYPVSASYEDGDVIDGNMNPVELVVVNGAVAVSNEAPIPDATKSVIEIFNDVYVDWYTPYVQYVYENSLMTGIKGTTRFAPDANITKAQVAQVLYNMESQPAETENKVFTELTDVYEAEWYAKAVSWAYNTGVVTGDTNAMKFFPNADVTREQLALMMYRYAKYKGYDVSASSNLEGLKNAENTADWALDGVKWAVGSGLISGIEKNGVKDLAPQGNASRAQMAAILQRFCENIR